MLKNKTNILQIQTTHIVTNYSVGQNWSYCIEENRDNDKQHCDY